MTEQLRPCYRHRRNVWMVGCPQCTEYHLPAAIARRDEKHTATHRPAVLAA